MHAWMPYSVFYTKMIIGIRRYSHCSSRISHFSQFNGHTHIFSEPGINPVPLIQLVQNQQEITGSALFWANGRRLAPAGQLCLLKGGMASRLDTLCAAPDAGAGTRNCISMGFLQQRQHRGDAGDAQGLELLRPDPMVEHLEGKECPYFPQRKHEADRHGPAHHRGSQTVARGG